MRFRVKGKLKNVAYLFIVFSLIVLISNYGENNTNEQKTIKNQRKTAKITVLETRYRHGHKNNDFMKTSGDFGDYFSFQKRMKELLDKTDFMTLHQKITPIHNCIFDPSNCQKDKTEFPLSDPNLIKTLTTHPNQKKTSSSSEIDPPNALENPNSTMNLTRQLDNVVKTDFPPSNPNLNKTMHPNQKKPSSPSEIDPPNALENLNSIMNLTRLVKTNFPLFDPNKILTPHPNQNKSITTSEIDPLNALENLNSTMNITGLFVMVVNQTQMVLLNDSNQMVLNDFNQTNVNGNYSDTVVTYFIVFQDLPTLKALLNPSGIGGYADRVLIQNVSLPVSWSPSEDLIFRLEERRKRVKEICHSRHFDERSSTNKPNAWEFLIEKNHGLIWCSVFKAASSNWYYNFNVLAGYKEDILLHAKDTPVSLARKKYPRPTVQQLDEALNSSSRTVAFMIARHPLERLVSAYRDKILAKKRYYRNLGKKILATYPEMSSPQEDVQKLTKSRSRTSQLKASMNYKAPNFQQFVQYIIDSRERGWPLDEHWVPINEFCSPCLVDFDVYAKVETMDEDGNYIIHKSGIKDIIHPKKINQAKDRPTDEVAKEYICQLTQEQRKKLFQVYDFDREIFDYNFDKYTNCSDVKY